MSLIQRNFLNEIRYFIKRKTLRDKFKLNFFDM